jgi:hypothetical protein
MLQTETVTPGTLELLKELMHDSTLQDFFLVGGTALSLQIGHRISIDITLSSTQPFDGEEMLTHLKSSGFRLNYQAKNTLKRQINNVQTDLITHAYPLVKPLKILDAVRLASLEDIAAMKLNAIVDNGTRLKDFIDLAFLSCHLSFSEMVAAYETKYDQRNPYIILKSLAYTNDVNKDEPIKFVAGKYSWDTIERRLKELPQHPNKIFSSL